MSTNDRKAIDGFLSQKRLAVVGVSRNASDFSRSVFCEFQKQGYDVVPVNPRATDLDGQRCYSHISEIQPPVEAALLFTTPGQTEEVVDECVRARVQHVWMHRGAGGPGAVHPRVVNLCRDHGINVVAGECPFMFLPNAHWFHRAHGLIKKLTGTYPH